VSDHGTAALVNANLADYLVPVNADVPDLDAAFVVSRLPWPPRSGEGLGELSSSGAAAIANAVFNATGRRIRDCRSPWTSCSS